jgi:hypothetical protein
LEVGVNVVGIAEGDSVGTEEGELVVGNMEVGAALVGLPAVGLKVGVNVVGVAEGDSVGTDEGEIVGVAVGSAEGATDGLPVVG